MRVEIETVFGCDLVLMKHSDYLILEKEAREKGIRFGQYILNRFFPTLSWPELFYAKDRKEWRQFIYIGSENLFTD